MLVPTLYLIVGKAYLLDLEDSLTHSEHCALGDLSFLVLFQQQPYLGALTANLLDLEEVVGIVAVMFEFIESLLIVASK